MAGTQQLTDRMWDIGVTMAVDFFINRPGLHAVPQSCLQAFCLLHQSCRRTGSALKCVAAVPRTRDPSISIFTCGSPH